MKPAPLRRIDIASPCNAPWEKMTGNSKVRHCAECNKNVFNLSAMAEAEAAALLADNADGDLCVRFYRRADGTVMTSDCSTTGRARRVLGKVPKIAGAAALALSVAGLSGSQDPAQGAIMVAANTGAAGTEHTWVMGDPVVSTPQPPSLPQPTMGKPLMTLEGADAQTLPNAPEELK